MNLPPWLDFIIKELDLPIREKRLYSVFPVLTLIIAAVIVRSEKYM